MELTKPSTSSSGDSIDLKTSFTDWVRGKVNQLTQTPNMATCRSLPVYVLPVTHHCLGESTLGVVILSATYKAFP